MVCSKSLLSLITMCLLVTGCGVNSTVSADNISATAVQTSASDVIPSFELLIEQKKTNGEIIPIGPKGVKSVSIDSYEYPINKLISDQLIIEIPNLVSGKHDLALSLYLVKDDFNVPLIIPNISQKVYVVLRLTVDENKRTITKIEYGYDQDKNGIIDTNVARFESSDVKTFYAITTDGVKRKIDDSKNSDKAVPDEAVPPPGVVPSSGPQKSDTSQPQIQLPEPPKPKTNDIELYPLPPSASRLPEAPIPLPIEVDKKTNNRDGQ